MAAAALPGEVEEKKKKNTCIFFVELAQRWKRKKNKGVVSVGHCRRPAEKAFEFFNKLGSSIRVDVYTAWLNKGVALYT